MISALFLMLLSGNTFAVCKPIVDEMVILDLECQVKDSRPSIEKVIVSLPSYLRRNVTFKRGVNIESKGPTGHLVSSFKSSSASLQNPRAIVWDEKTGFSMSWNGHPSQRAHNRIDLYQFDFSKAKHVLAIYDPADSQVLNSGKDCQSCHGPTSRPIWSMYPDWPQFYGEFNDEMAGYSRTKANRYANKFQDFERKHYQSFKNNVAPTHDRYAPLFEKAHMRRWLKLWPKPVQSSTRGNQNYPYRPNNKSGYSQMSRAFHFRPNLRLGVLYNRFMALETYARFRKSSVFNKYQELVLFNLMDCNWQKFPTTREKVLSKFEQDLAALGKTVNWGGFKGVFGTSYAKGFKYRQIPYEELLRAFDMEVREVDFRFKYNTKLTVRGHQVYTTASFYNTESVMDIGYLETKYRRHRDKFPYIAGMRYFNSYFDGSATTNELIASMILRKLALERPQVYGQYDNSTYLRSLRDKYRSSGTRYQRDKKFFASVDGMSKWLPLPYPRNLEKLHNREGFWGTRNNWDDKHEKICKAVVGQLWKNF